MDRAVLDAYGWTDLQPTCEFLLVYKNAEGDDGGRRKKKPWRYRWPDAMRDEVLARLLALNGERAAEERATAEAKIVPKVPRKAPGVPRRTPKTAKAGPAGDGGTGGLLGID